MVVTEEGILFRGGGRIQVNLDWVIIAAVRTFSDFQNGKQICHSLPSEKFGIKIQTISYNFYVVWVRIRNAGALYYI